MRILSTKFAHSERSINSVKRIRPILRSRITMVRKHKRNKIGKFCVWHSFTHFAASCCSFRFFEALSASCQSTMYWKFPPIVFFKCLETELGNFYTSHEPQRGSLNTEWLSELFAQAWIKWPWYEVAVTTVHVLVFFLQWPWIVVWLASFSLLYSVLKKEHGN